MRTLFFLCQLIPFLLLAQPSFNWAKSMGGIDIDHANAITVDSSGNVYVAGEFGYTVDFDPGPGVYTVTASGAMDVYIAKYTPAGTLSWVKTLGGTGYCQKIKIDTAGNIIAAGYFTFLDFDPGVGTYTLATGSGWVDAFVCKLDKQGNFVWAKRIGSTLDDGAYALAVDLSGSVYFGGGYEGSVDLDPGAGTYTTFSAGSTANSYICKLDASGNFVWGRTFASGNHDYITDMSVSVTGALFFTGVYNNTLAYHLNTTFSVTSMGPNAGYFGKMDQSGNLLFLKSCYGTANAGCYSVVPDRFGYLQIGGTFSGTLDVDPSSTSYTLADVNGQSYVARYDTLGNLKWGINYAGNSSFGSQSAIAVDLSGNIYCTGNFGGIADFEPGVGTTTLSITTGEDYICKFDSAGNFKWVKNFGSGQPTALTIDKHLNIYHCGYYKVAFDFDPYAPVTYLQPVSQFDAYFCKWNGNCAPINQLSITTPSPLCSATGNTLYLPSATNYTWFANATTTTVLQTGTSFTVPAMSSGTYSYYVFAENCTVSAGRLPVQITVHSTPTISMASGSICVGQQFTLTPLGADSFTISGSNTTVSPSVTSSYSATGISSVGCIASNTAVALVTVYSNPTISVSNGSICAGNTFTFAPAGASSYSYSSGSFTVTPLNTSTYQITGSNIQGCAATNTATCIVTVLATPTLVINAPPKVCIGKQFMITASGSSTYTWSDGSHAPLKLYTVTSNTVLNLSGTAANGCSNSTSVSIATHSLPVIIAVSNYSAICLNDFVTLSASGISNAIDWYSISATGTVMIAFSQSPPASLSHSPAITTTYIAEGVDGNQCKGSGSVTVIVNPLPDISIASSKSIVCIGEEVSFTASGAQSYSLSGVYFNSTISFSPVISQIHTITGTNGFGCTNTVAIYQVVDECTNLKSIIRNELTSVFPNPAFELLYVTGSETSAFLLFDATGREVLKGYVERGTSEISISQLPAGLYSLIVQGMSATSCHRIIKK